ncbi:MAG TPA: ISNCY family transposase, partial [Candidatus Acidoferrales bacterium]|nr:ISNCY family transposase [Candidatus Acidoferrales bacterium]
TPDFSTFSRLFSLLGPSVTEKIHQRVVKVAREQGVAQGRKLRTDTTVVESNIHYPTDSSLLGDGIRVLSRGLARIAAQCKSGAVKLVKHARAVKHRLIEISRAAKSLTPTNKRRMKKSYKKLLALTRQMMRESSKVIQRWRKGKLPVVGSWVSVETQIARLQHFLPLVDKVMQQTKQRVFGGNRHARGKVLSLFEPHSQVIRKGKAHKPNEFGRLLRLDEVENGIVSGYEVLQGNPDDSTGFIPAVKQHQASFGRAPEMATADRGFFSAKNEREAKELGVKKVALPTRGRLSRKRAQHQKQRWFQRAMRWRAGIEATVSHLKHPFAMARALYKGESGFQRYVGWSVITKNLFSIARWQERKKQQQRKSHDQVDGVLRAAAQATR